MKVLFRLIIAAIVALSSLFSYCTSSSQNVITGEEQRVGLTAEEEVLLGQQSAPEMIAEYGGLDTDSSAADRVQRIGKELISPIKDKLPYAYEFHLLDDPKTINAFALPGGQVFLTEGLYRELKTDGQLAGVLGHEISHVVARHGAEHIAKAQLTQGLTGAALIATYDPENSNSRQRAQMAVLVGQLVNMKFGREDELEADRLGLGLTAEAGYDPRSLKDVMDVLAKAGDGKAPPEFFSTHPNPKNRKSKIDEAIATLFPDGVPSGLTP